MIKNLHGRQQGLSLIELMVAMLIGLFLILGVTQIFINNQRSYLFQQGQIGNQENGRFALALLSQELLKAGYRSDPKSPLTADNSLTSCNLNAGAGVAAVSASSLCIQYQATNRADVNCQGAALSDANRNAIVTPYGQTNPKVVERIEFDATTGSITCTTSAGSQQLVTGVKDLRFEYGSGPGNGSKTVTAWSATPSASSTIAAVRYNVLMQNPGTSAIRDNTSLASAALTDWNSRFGTTYGTSNDDKTSIYQYVQGTIMIRNQMQ
ncbi:MULTISPECIES: PilW family protein [unclassified Pseudomonas]|uniref:PilW family protein n=1 Tax=unclassified Pseudomonas TaxID=196821 RepID=UPI000D3D4468|nr:MULTISPECIES: PilW family protein [unclassified Pseudomonas]RAU44951.1 prepilin-type N-terminal cleavage/methylation domain-containing protein [Pseudomonas sp. RIT 409]RAU53524.1 prepilin-type N-terminal cleavage/methylation domain-containing protein [Pseudomonas sp. RIT 412]